MIEDSEESRKTVEALKPILDELVGIQSYKANLKELGKELNAARRYHLNNIIRENEKMLFILKALVRHDVAADKREHLEHCFELQDAINFLATQED